MTSLAEHAANAGVTAVCAVLDDPAAQVIVIVREGTTWRAVWRNVSDAEMMTALRCIVDPMTKSRGARDCEAAS